MFLFSRASWRDTRHTQPERRVLALRMVASHRRHRLRHENMYNFAQNFDQNRLLGQKLCQNGNRSIKKIEFDFFSILIFPFFIQLPMNIFDFFRSQKFSEKTQNSHFPFF